MQRFRKPNDSVQEALQAETSTLQRCFTVLWPLKHTLSTSVSVTLFSRGTSGRRASFALRLFLSPVHLLPFLLLCELLCSPLPPTCVCAYAYRAVIGVWPILRTAERVHGRDVSTYLPTPRGIELPPRAPMWQLSYLTYRLGNCIDTFFFNGGVPQAGGPQASAVTQAARPSRLV